MWSLFLLECHYLAIRQLRQCLKPSAAASTRHSGHCPLLLRAFKPAVCQPSGHGPPLLTLSSLPFVSPQMPKICRGSFDQALWSQAFLVRALKPAVCLQEPLLLALSSLPFASLQMPKCTAAASTRHSGHCLLLLKAFKPAVCQPSGHCPLLLGRSRLPFIRQMPKMSRGSFDQALWPQAFVVGALKPAVCLHGPLLLGRSNLPFASP